MNKIRVRKVTLLYKKKPHQVHVHCIPAKGQWLRVQLKGTADLLTLRVRKVLYAIAERDRSILVELSVSASKRRVAPSTDHVTSRFQVELDWPAGTCPPCIGDRVRLHGPGREGLPELMVLRVTHEIDQAKKTHTIKVQVIDDSPKRFFSPEDIQAALTDEIEPLVL
jgi:hypothetical protein